MPDVYIAIGHGRRPDGSFDPGATDGSHSEQKDAVPVATACTQVLRNHGLEVISEHEDEDDPNYPGTTKRANEAGVNCVVSFHYDWNQAPPGAFAIATTDDARELGWAIENRVKEAGFDIRDYPDDRDGLYLLDNSHAPAVIFECGRIGHEDIDETHEQRAMGEAAARGILDWMGVDMAVSNWAKDAWEWAKGERILSADSNPKDTVTKEELAVILKRYHRVAVAAITTAVASVAGSAVGVDEVIAELIRRLGG